MTFKVDVLVEPRFAEILEAFANEDELAVAGEGSELEDQIDELPREFLHDGGCQHRR